MDKQALTGTARVAIHSPDPLTRAGLVSFLQRERRIQEVGPDRVQEADTIVTATDVFDAAALDELRAVCDRPDVRFMVLVGKQWQANVAMAVDRGVRAVLWRHDVTPAVLIRTLLTVVDGGGVLPPTLQGMLMRQVQQIHQEVLTPNGLTASGFSTREVHVLRMVAEGKELSEIATRLCYSERTVKYILYGLMQRLGLRNRAHAVSYAISAGLI